MAMGFLNKLVKGDGEKATEVLKSIIENNDAFMTLRTRETDQDTGLKLRSFGRVQDAVEILKGTPTAYELYAQSQRDTRDFGEGRCKETEISNAYKCESENVKEQWDVKAKAEANQRQQKFGASARESDSSKKAQRMLLSFVAPKENSGDGKHLSRLLPVSYDLLRECIKARTAVDNGDSASWEPHGRARSGSN